MKNNIFFLLSGLIFGGVLAIIILSTSSSDSVRIRTDNQQITRGKEILDFSLTTLNGEVVSIDDYKGHPMIINFWATWCPPCKEEMPLLEKAYVSYYPDLVVIGISVDDVADEIPQFIRDNGITFPVFHDSSKGELQALFKVNGLPTTYFIDSEGILQSQHIGMLNEPSLDGYLRTIGVE